MKQAQKMHPKSQTQSAQHVKRLRLQEWHARLQSELSKTQALALQLQAAITSIQAELLEGSRRWLDGKAEGDGGVALRG